MDYSLQAYIDRLPTERLEAFLEQYYAGQLQEDFTSMIPYLEYVLAKRKADKQ